MKALLITSAAAALGVVTAPTAKAATLTFATAADYDQNFHEINAGGAVAWNAGGYVQMTGTSAVAAIYNTTATGGSGGSGGTASGSTLDKFVNVSLQADVAFADTFSAGSGSFGFYTNVNDARTSGYAAIFRIESGSTATFRLFDSDGNPSTSGVGTQIGSTSTFTTTGAFTVGTYYTYKLDVQTVGSNVQFTASIFTVGGAQIGSSIILTDTTSAITGGGQVGFRAGSVNVNGGSYTRFDNFSVTPAAIPEPSTFALLGGLAVLCLAAVRRRR